MKFYFLDKLGWPIETITGRSFINIIRRLLHTRGVTTSRPKVLDPAVPASERSDDWPREG